MIHDSIFRLLQSEFAHAIAALTGAVPSPADSAVRPAGDPKFGDYQCNAAMGLAKALKAKPRDIAEQIKSKAEEHLADVIEPLEIAGPGFINIRLKDSFLAGYLGRIEPAAGEGGQGSRNQGIEGVREGIEGLRDSGIEEGKPGAAWPLTDRVGIPAVDQPLRVVVEYSQPNIAKQMHVGHLRSTIIGDVFARVLGFLGHEIVRQNHIGDWGTQFGMLIRWYREHPLPTPATHADVIEAIENDYKAANVRFKEDEAFATEARAAVAQLQGGDPDARRVWEQICGVSWDAFTEIYDRLGVLLERSDVRGESFYNPMLAGIVAEMERVGGDQGIEGSRDQGIEGARDQGIEGSREQGNEGGAGESAATAPPIQVRRDAGAVVVYLYDQAGQPLFKNAEGEVLGMIIQKSDGAYLYATTDLAAIRFRLKDLPFPSGGVGAQRVVYVTDARQKLHFEQFFAAARAAGWITNQQVDHVTFGSVLGADRKPLKTREGGTVKLKTLLEEAEKRALELLEKRAAEASAGSSDEAELAGEARQHIARRVGVAAVKYADLRNDRNADYVFDWDKMLALTGNTAPYMMYAYARIRSIYRKAAERFGSPDVYAPGVTLAVAEPTERALALRLSRLREAIDVVAADLTPHVLCTYLYDLAADFMRFYESCPVLDAPSEAARLSRMRLCDLTARTLKLGLGLLGIEVIERM